MLAAGGLHVIGTERHESRRIDNQLRGRSGRQGDPGESRFYVSLEDDIMRLFGGDQVARLMDIFKLPEDVPLEHAMVTRALEQAQMKVEGFHFDNRKHLVDYDDVLNKQREIVYRRRRKILEGADQKESIVKKITEEIGAFVMAIAAGEGGIDRQKIVSEFVSVIPFDPNSQEQLIKQLEQLHSADEIAEFLQKIAADAYAQRETQVTPDVMRQIERWVSLQVIDNLWMDHLDAIDDLREGIGLRGYGQRDPLVEYKNEAFSMFERLLASIDTGIVHRIFKIQVQLAPKEQGKGAPSPAALPKTETPISQAAKNMRTNAPDAAVSKAPRVVEKKIGRNDPCWCGSGKKFKRCHYPELPA